VYYAIENKPDLYKNGILFKIKDKTITVVGTTTHKFAMYEQPYVEMCDDIEIFVHLDVVNLLKNIEGDVCLKFSNKFDEDVKEFMFVSSRDIIISEEPGKFVKYNNIIEIVTKYTDSFRFIREDLITQLKYVSQIVGKDKRIKIDINGKDGNAVINYNDVIDDKIIKIKVACESEHNFICNFNLDDLIAAVNAVNELLITFYYSDDGYMVLIKDDDYTQQIICSFINILKKD
jgi:DNA polymerase III sliding clamp (beta) subunit (PCNA family)